MALVKALIKGLAAAVLGTAAAGTVVLLGAALGFALGLLIFPAAGLGAMALCGWAVCKAVRGDGGARVRVRIGRSPALRLETRGEGRASGADVREG